MENINTVVISLVEYNELRDFKHNVESNLKKEKFIVIEETVFCGNTLATWKYYTKDEILQDFEKQNRILAREVSESKRISKEAMHQLKLVRKMSILQFLKYRK